MLQTALPKEPPSVGTKAFIENGEKKFKELSSEYKRKEEHRRLKAEAEAEKAAEKEREHLQSLAEEKQRKIQAKIDKKCYAELQQEKRLYKHYSSYFEELLDILDLVSSTTGQAAMPETREQLAEMNSSFRKLFEYFKINKKN